MRKVTTTLLVGAGAVSGLVMSVALPAGAATAGGGFGPPGGGGTGSPQPVPGSCPTATGVPYAFTGQVANGPDAGQVTLGGTLCIDPTRPNADDRRTDDHGDDDNEGPPARVTGTISVDQAVTKNAPTAALRAASVIPVRGALDGSNIRFEGRQRVAAVPSANQATAASNAAVARRAALFIRATGVQLQELQRNATARGVTYGGTFDGVRRGDSGRWTAPPAQAMPAPAPQPK